MSRDGIMIDSQKVEAILHWEKPKTATEIRSFLSLSGYYRIFIQDFSRIAAPMTRLTQKGVKFIWSDRCEDSFQKLKECLTNAPVLILPSSSGDFFCVLCRI